MTYECPKRPCGEGGARRRRVGRVNVNGTTAGSGVGVLYVVPRLGRLGPDRQIAGHSPEPGAPSPGFEVGQTVVWTMVTRWDWDGREWLQLGRGLGVNDMVRKVVPWAGGHVAVGRSLATRVGHARASGRSGVANRAMTDWSNN